MKETHVLWLGELVSDDHKSAAMVISHSVPVTMI